MQLAHYQNKFTYDMVAALFIYYNSSCQLVGGITLDNNVRYGVAKTGHIDY